MFVRRKRNKSGSTSIQIIEKRQRRNVVVCSVGSARELKEIERLEAEDEDDLRRIGFSKDGKFQHPQIILKRAVKEQMMDAGG